MRVLVWFVMVGAGCGRLNFGEVGDDGSAFDGGDGDARNSDANAAELGDALVSAGACPTSLVSDSFDDGVIDPTWVGSYDPKIALAEAGSHLVFTFSANASNGSETSVTTPVSDLRGRCVTLTVAAIRGGNAATGMDIGTASAYIRVQVGGTTLGAVDVPFKGGVPPSFTYDPVAHAKWRIQFGGGRVVVVALDGSGAPTQLVNDLPSFFDESAATIRIYSRVFMSQVSGGTAELDAIDY